MSNHTIDINRLNAFAREMTQRKKTAVGFPCNQDVRLAEFYHWYAVSGLADLAMNNVGDPRRPSLYSLNTHDFENEVIDFFAPLYGLRRRRRGASSPAAARTATTTASISA